jgi:hypothetical protein
VRTETDDAGCLRGGQPRRMETCGAEEPYEGNLHVRFCGGVGRATADPTRTRAAKPLGRENDALIRRLDVLGGQIASVVKFNALAQEECVGFPVLGNLPTVCQVRNDGLATIAWVTPNQVIVHAALGVYIGVGAGLVHIKMGRGTEDSIP